MWTVSSSYGEARREARRNRAQVRKMAEFRLRGYRARLPGRGRAEIGRRPAESNRARLEAVPDLDRYPELPGTRDGAGLGGARRAVACEENRKEDIVFSEMFLWG